VKHHASFFAVFSGVCFLNLFLYPSPRFYKNGRGESDSLL
jgi:hypothetical protein